MKRILLVMSVAALMVAMIVATAMPAFAAPKSAHGTCEVGGSGQGAFGCAGNVGGFIFVTPQGECREINQGPFSERTCFEE